MNFAQSLKHVRDLQATGFPEDQAAEIVDGAAEMTSDSVDRDSLIRRFEGVGIARQGAEWIADLIVEAHQKIHSREAAKFGGKK